MMTFPLILGGGNFGDKWVSRDLVEIVIEILMCTIKLGENNNCQKTNAGNDYLVWFLQLVNLFLINSLSFKVN